LSIRTLGHWVAVGNDADLLAFLCEQMDRDLKIMKQY